MFLKALLVAHVVLVTSWKTVDDLPVLGELGCEDCVRIYAPVCASDNKTYTNECRMNCHNANKMFRDKAYVKRYGRCVMNYRRNDKDLNFLKNIARRLIKPKRNYFKPEEINHTKCNSMHC